MYNSRDACTIMYGLDKNISKDKLRSGGFIIGAIRGGFESSLNACMCCFK